MGLRVLPLTLCFLYLLDCCVDIANIKAADGAGVLKREMLLRVPSSPLLLAPALFVASTIASARDSSVSRLILTAVITAEVHERTCAARNEQWCQ